MPNVLTKEDIQDILGIGRDKTRNLFKLKGFPVIYLNNKAVVLEDDFLEWLREHRGKTVIL